MQLKRLTASFGTLNGQTLVLSPGLNVITAPNESGKTTWCAFIRAMLYGLDTAERKRDGFLPDKTRYVPWGGAPMEGVMELEHGDRDITLIRRTKTAAAPMRDFRAVYTGADEPVPGFSGTNAGELLTGVSASVFDRSAMVRTSALAVSGSPELEKRISSLVSTGDEGDSYSEADSRLRAASRRRRFNKYGSLPELEAELEAQTLLLSRLREAAVDLERLETDLSDAEAEAELRLAQLSEHRARTRRRALDSVAESKQKVAQAEANLEKAMETAAACRAALEADPLSAIPPEELETRTSADYGDAKMCERVAAMRPSPLPVILAFILALVCAALGWFVNRWCYIGAGALLLLCLPLLLSYLRRRKAAASALEKLGGILERYGLPNAAGIIEACNRCSELRDMLLEAEEALDEARRSAESSRHMRDMQNAELVRELNFSSGDGDDSTQGRALNGAQERLRAAREQRAMAEGRLKTLGDPLVLESDIAELERRRDELSFEYNALALAIATLAEANAEIQARFSPRLSRLATEYMLRMTSGRYEELSLDRSFAASARREGDAVPHESAYLSAGTGDQLWLSLRLAICRLALPEDEPCPIILDDVLVNFDPVRRQAALELLGEIANERQIILFTNS